MIQFWGELNNFCALIPVQAQQQQLSMRTTTCEWRKGGGVPPGAEVYSPGNLLAVISYNACYVWSMKLSFLLQTHEDWIVVQWGCLVVLPVLLSPKPERRNCSKKVIKLLENEWGAGLVGCSYSLTEHKHVYTEQRRSKLQFSAENSLPKFRKETLLASAKSRHKMEQLAGLVNWIYKKKEHEDL